MKFKKQISNLELWRWFGQWPERGWEQVCQLKNNNPNCHLFSNDKEIKRCLIIFLIGHGYKWKKYYVKINKIKMKFGSLVLCSIKTLYLQIKIIMWMKMEQPNIHKGSWTLILVNQKCELTSLVNWALWIIFLTKNYERILVQSTY